VIFGEQGSGTVAITLTAGVMQPLLGPLGLESPQNRALCVVAIGCGALAASHVNDSFFWVYARLSKLTVAESLRTLTLCSALASVAAFLFTAVASISEWIAPVALPLPVIAVVLLRLRPTRNTEAQPTRLYDDVELSQGGSDNTLRDDQSAIT